MFLQELLSCGLACTLLAIIQRYCCIVLQQKLSLVQHLCRSPLCQHPTVLNAVIQFTKHDQQSSKSECDPWLHQEIKEICVPCAHASWLFDTLCVNDSPSNQGFLAPMAMGLKTLI